MRVGGWVIKRLCAGLAGSFGRPRPATTRACQRGGDGRRRAAEQAPPTNGSPGGCVSAKGALTRDAPSEEAWGRQPAARGARAGAGGAGEKIRPAGVCARSRGRCCGIPVNAHARWGSGTSPHSHTASRKNGPSRSDASASASATQVPSHRREERGVTPVGADFFETRRTPEDRSPTSLSGRRRLRP